MALVTSVLSYVDCLPGYVTLENHLLNTNVGIGIFLTNL